MNIIIKIIVFSSLSFVAQSQNAWQQDLLNQVNALRQKGCRCGNKNFPTTKVLTWNNDLELSSSNHAIDMDVKRYFSHQSPNGDGFAERIEKAGYNWGRSGENIATGQTSVNEVFMAWRKSPSHCKNMMNAEFKEMGAARSSNYWVQDFGTLLEIKPAKKR